MRVQDTCSSFASLRNHKVSRAFLLLFLPNSAPHRAAVWQREHRTEELSVLACDNDLWPLTSFNQMGCSFPLPSLTGC